MFYLSLTCYECVMVVPMGTVRGSFYYLVFKCLIFNFSGIHEIVRLAKDVRNLMNNL